MKTIEKLLQEYYSKASNYEHQRFGQFFCNVYGYNHNLCPWPDLFHCAHTVESVRIIDQWLRDNGYENRNLPVKPKI